MADYIAERDNLRELRALLKDLKDYHINRKSKKKMRKILGSLLTNSSSQVIPAPGAAALDVSNLKQDIQAQEINEQREAVLSRRQIDRR